IYLACKRVNQSQIGRAVHSVEGVGALETEFNGAATFANSLLFPAHVSVEYSQSSIVYGVVGMIAHIFLQSRSHFFKKGARQFHIATSKRGLSLIKTLRTNIRKIV